MIRQLLGRVVLAVVLLAAWQSSLVHPLQHTDGHGGFVHLADGQDKKSGASELCDALAALAACAAAAPQGSLGLPTAESTTSRSAIVVLPAEAPPFLSQGPPALL